MIILEVGVWVGLRALIGEKKDMKRIERDVKTWPWHRGGISERIEAKWVKELFEDEDPDGEL